jgi:hypothetical protein
VERGLVREVGTSPQDPNTLHTRCDHALASLARRPEVGLQQSTWDVLAAVDFTTIEVWTKRGLVTCSLLFVVEVASRRVHFAGGTPSSHDQWMSRMAINLTDCVDGFLLGKRYVLMDRDAKFSAAFRNILAAADIKSVRLPPQSPNLNAHLERFFGSLKSKCLNRMIFIGEESLRRAVRHFLAHHHEERTHQGLGNRPISPGKEAGRTAGAIERRERLGALLQYYHRRAA